MNFFRKPDKPDDAADEQLLNSYQLNGDITILGKLYERHMPLVYGVCLKYLTDEELARDAVMNIFEELVTKTKQHEIKLFRSWLYVLSRNHCLMQLRAGKKMTTVGIDDFMEFVPNVHPDDNSKEERLQALEQCIEKLASAQQKSVRLFYLDEKCYKEIAEATGYTLNEVKSFIQNGKRNLKICLEKNSGK
jgi:RNA polymerase sigma factor (sigma-70 family)